jgi:hypothetical protein
VARPVKKDWGRRKVKNKGRTFPRGMGWTAFISMEMRIPSNRVKMKAKRDWKENPSK